MALTTVQTVIIDERASAFHCNRALLVRSRRVQGKMGDITSRALFTFGAGTAGALALWWLWNAKSREEDQKPDPSCFQRPVAKVVKLCVYPVKSCKGLELPTFHCGVRGLKYDRYYLCVNTFTGSQCITCPS